MKTTHVIINFLRHKIHDDYSRDNNLINAENIIFSLHKIVSVNGGLSVMRLQMICTLLVLNLVVCRQKPNHAKLWLELFFYCYNACHVLNLALYILKQNQPNLLRTILYLIYCRFIFRQWVIHHYSNTLHYKKKHFVRGKFSGLVMIRATMVKTHRFRPARNNISSVSLAKNIKHNNRYQNELSLRYK